MGLDLSVATLSDTSFVNVDLSETVGLDQVKPYGRSIIDYLTLERSGELPLVFLRGAGLPERMIDSLPGMFGEAIQFYSCFISYTSANDDFAQRLHADLQDAGVRCWFAPEDLKIGDPVRDTIDQAIRVMDKLVLILSEASIDSDWVEHEVNRALAEEERRGKLVLFPIRLDDAVIESEFGWAKKSPNSVGRRRVRIRLGEENPRGAQADRTPHRRLLALERPRPVSGGLRAAAAGPRARRERRGRLGARLATPRHSAPRTVSVEFELAGRQLETDQNLEVGAAKSRPQRDQLLDFLDDAGAPLGGLEDER